MILILVICLAVSAWGKPADKRDPMINEGLFEGDIMGVDPSNDRNAIPHDSQRWPGGLVPYVIDPSLNPIFSKISDAIMHIQRTTCIRFTPKTSEHKNFVRMYKGTGCWSYWGNLNRGQQDLSLGTGCEYFGTIVHEILHALGFQHEHNRSDRDDYLTINWENIENEWYYAFKKLLPHENRMLSSFDFDSIMLYGQTSFAKSYGLKSMEAKDGRFMPEVYNKNEMSASDIQRINKLYGC